MLHRGLAVNGLARSNALEQGMTVFPGGRRFPASGVMSIEGAITMDNGPALRRLRDEDAADVLAAFASNGDMNRQGDVSSLEGAGHYVGNLLRPGSAHEPWAITEHDRLVGLVCVTVDEANRSGWFWYWMHSAARGRGLARRAAATVADWALSERGLDRLELGHRVNNPASGVVARAAGFVKEGTERAKFLIEGSRVDVDTYGRLASDAAPDFVALPMRTDPPYLTSRVSRRK